jgi:hypothetical protein
MQAGVEFPPIIVDRLTKTVVDGYHRCEAHRKVYGEDSSIEVEAREYGSEAEMFLDAIRLNARHGKPLTTADWATCAIKAKELSVEIERISGLMGVPVERVRYQEAQRVAYTPDEKPVVLTRPTRWLAGKVLSEKQLEGVRRAQGGLSALVYINQIIMLIETDCLDWDNRRIAIRLKRLHDLLCPMFQ